MAKYLREFETHAQYEAYVADKSNLVLPNVSICNNVPNEVHFNPWVDTRLVAKFNIIDTTNDTKIIGINKETAFTSIEIDGAEQPSVTSGYKFNSTGEHTIKYTLADPTKIDNSSFGNCDRLTSVCIPYTVTSIGKWAFQRCTSLTSIDIPDSVTSIDGFVFDECSGLTSIVIPSGVTSIGEYAFQNCTGLTSIDIPDSVVTIGNSAFNKCSGLTSCTIGSGVTSIGSYTFQNCISLETITIPDMVRSIGASVFNNCSAMTSCNIGSDVTSIGNNAFSNCKSLISITIPSGVTSIGNSAFQYCSSLESITSLRTSAPSIQTSTFYYIKSNGTLYVPSGSSGYDVWMGTGNYYLGKYNWTKVEQ